MRGKLNDEHVRQPVEGLETGKAFKVERIRRIPDTQGLAIAGEPGMALESRMGMGQTRRLEKLVTFKGLECFQDHSQE